MYKFKKIIKLLTILAFNVHLVAKIKNWYHISHVISAIPTTQVNTQEKSCTCKTGDMYKNDYSRASQNKTWKHLKQVSL